MRRAVAATVIVAGRREVRSNIVSYLSCVFILPVNFSESGIEDGQTAEVDAGDVLGNRTSTGESAAFATTRSDHITYFERTEIPAGCL